MAEALIHPPTMRPRTAIKETVYGAGYWTGVPRWGRHRARRSLTILTYHSFGPAEPYPYLARLPVARFMAQLRHLKEHYRLVSLADGLRRLEAEEGGDRPLVALTVDDGFGDNFEYLFPIVREARIPVTIFVATDYLDSGRLPWPTRIGALLRFARGERLERPLRLMLDTEVRLAQAGLALRQYLSRLPAAAREIALADLERDLAPSPFETAPPLTWDQLRAMHRGGVEIGSHTCFHGWLDRLDPDEIAWELGESKRRIESQLGAPCRLLAYPNGNWDKRIAEAAARAGYDYALTQEKGVNRKAWLAPYALRRIEVPHDEWIGTFACRVSGVAL
jgi:peptidoglycan/xylan/chitin deacetylase (PgdA/CDA1 family)